MAQFFQVVWSYDSAGELIEFLGRRYSDLRTILELDLPDFCIFLDKARESFNEERIWQRWLSLQEMMYSGRIKWTGYNEFKDLITGANIDNRSNEEIIAELEELHGKTLL